MTGFEDVPIANLVLFNLILIRTYLFSLNAKRKITVLYVLYVAMSYES